jgi:hypothetical protein
VPEVAFVSDDVLRIARVVGLGGGEEPEQRALGPQHARQLVGQRLRGRPIEVVDEVPAQDAVDRRGLLREAVPQRLGEAFGRPGADVAVQIGEQILDEDLAAELLAEEADVGADDGPQVEEHRRLAPREAGQALAERLG